MTDDIETFTANLSKQIESDINDWMEVIETGYHFKVQLIAEELPGLDD